MHDTIILNEFQLFPLYLKQFQDLLIIAISCQLPKANAKKILKDALFIPLITLIDMNAAGRINLSALPKKTPCLSAGDEFGIPEGDCFTNS
jgi:hypothetical protein